MFREVRAAFKEEWRDFYADSRAGATAEALAETKADLLERQTAALDKGRKAGCDALREQRDGDYAGLLSDQKEQRAELTLAQKNGERSPELLACIYGEPAERGAYDLNGMVERGREASLDRVSAFRQAGAEICEPTRQTEVTERESEPAAQDRGHDDLAAVKDGLDAVGGIGLGLLGGIAKLGEKLFDGFLGGGPATPPPRPAPDRSEQNKDREAAMRAAALQASQTSEESEAKRLRAYWDDRAHRRRDRDGARV